VQPALGRTFAAEEDRDVEGAYPYAVISHRLWRDQFRGDSSIVGSAVRINGRLVTIVGVVPPPFRGSFNGLSLDVWVHLSMIHLMGGAGSWQAADRNAKPLKFIGRLRSDATLEQARAQAEAVARRLAAEYPATHAGSGAVVLPLWKSHFGVQGILISPLAALTAVSILLLLVACANVANLLLARSLSRQAEYALRLAMGAGPMRLFGQMFMEGLLLAIAATGVGLLFAMWMGDTMLWLIPVTDFPLSSFTHVEVNARMISLAFVLCLLVAVLSAIAPALHVFRSDPAGSLRESGRSCTSSRAAHITRRWLVIGEVALSCVAIMGAGLFVRSFRKSTQAKLGFDPGGVTVARLYLSSAGYSAEEETRFDRMLVEKLRDAPGVESASYAIELPLLGSGSETTEVEGYTAREGEDMQIARNNVGPDYFRLLRIPQLAGVEFTQHDDQRGRPVVIVNRAFAQRFFPGRDPIGKRLRIAQGKRWSTIVGVVEDTKQGNPLEASRPVYYAPFQQMFASGHENYLLIRARRPAEALAALRIAVDSITSAGGLYQARPLNTYVQGSMFALLVTASLMSTLGVMSLILAGVGLYSVTAYAVGERTREIAVRMALGATPAQVLRLVLRESVGMIGWGWLIGAGVALAAARAVAGMLAGIVPNDPVVFGAAALFLGLVAVIACLLPARRAIRIDPVNALRCE
jgi:predicted permease